VTGADHPSRASAGAYLRRHAGFLLLLVVTMTVPAYLRDSYYLSNLAFMATKFMMVIGLSLLVGQAGQISLGQAGFVGIGAYGAAVLSTKAGLNPWLAMALAALMAAVIAALVGLPTLRLRGYYLAMATLGVNEIIYILLRELKEVTNGVDGISGIPALSMGGANLRTPWVYHLVVWAVALLMFRVALNLSRSRVGRSLRALHQSESAAEALGVNTSFRKVQVFVLAAVFASVAGSFDAYYVRFVSPEGYTISLSILLITAAIIGGLRNVWGALWGTVVIVVLPELLKRLGVEDYRDLVFGALLVAIMILFHGRSEWWRQTLARRRKRQPGESPDA
jgi:branched-chain amino acid transport system permease protein